ncbi:MAG: hypothetical protein K2I72_01395 [Bacilli bacterium]|nr:hypothetical protein [Bacilli bacterium]
MDCLETSHIINELKSGRKINVIFMSHNSYWPELKELEGQYENCHVVLCEDGLFYLKGKKTEDIENCDLVLFYSSHFYSEKNLNGIKEIVSRISQSQNKRVSFGYSYVIPKYERVDPFTSNEVQLVSFKDGIEYDETAYGFPYFDALNLAEMTLVTHDELEKQKIKLPNP